MPVTLAIDVHAMRRFDVNRYGFGWQVGIDDPVPEGVRKSSDVMLSVDEAEAYFLKLDKQVRSLGYHCEKPAVLPTLWGSHRWFYEETSTWGSAPAAATQAPMCGCGKPTWNGRWNEPCTRSCPGPRVAQNGDITFSAPAPLAKDPQDFARKYIEDALKNISTPVLKEALAVAKKAGLEPKDYATVETALVQEEEKELARKQIEDALKNISTPVLKEALAAAKKTGLKPEDYATVETALVQEEEKELARKQIEDALKNISTPVLKEALATAKKAGLKPEDYATVETALVQEEEKEIGAGDYPPDAKQQA
eukprot:TRINITY_DN194_c1_g1_i3.p1 TRINITY_DN194_c1_g1~~TRINITY_DN194_c1_g1_i3.p1  ORF type:complete len:309 (+),score=77.31 TRINITY_DN194_c1_g1_i3:46-972(+)